MRKIYYFSILLLVTSTNCMSQSKSDQAREKWLLQEQSRQYEFLKTFVTTRYICEEKQRVTFIYDIDKKLWRHEINRRSTPRSAETYTIIKSDDIKERDSLCGISDEPLSTSVNLNKFYCIINNWDGGQTHKKCLLEIKENISNKKPVHTLVCGKGSFKFNITHEKIFENNFGIGPYSANHDSLEQSMTVKDCIKFGN